MAPTPLPEFWVSKARLETLLDGVFAIAMTLMVLEIRIPELQNRRSMPELMSQVRHNWAPIFGFLLSVGVLGVFWYKHHRQYHLIHRRNVVAALGVSIVSALYICTALWAEHSGSERSWVGLIPLLMLPFGIALRRWAKRQGI